MTINLVADLFAQDYSGGAELTTEALFENKEDSLVERIYSHLLTEEIVKSSITDKWVFGNFSKLSDSVMLFFAKNKLDYHVLEYDYKFCSHRSPTLHQAATNEKCQCSQSPHGKIVSLFLAMSKNVFWMSEKQLQDYEHHFPHIKKGRHTVLSSVFSQRDLKYIQELGKCVEKSNNKYLILNSGSPVKNTVGCIKYAEDNSLPYELVGNMPYFQFLRHLASMKGIIFFPVSEDTCPRLVIEAKLLGCDIKSNEFVQHQKEDWFSENNKIIKYLEDRTSVFWDKASG